jgi:hypothetical protein
MIKLKTYNRNVDKFISEMLEDCEKRGINVLISLEKYLKDDGIKTNGYFDEDRKTLAISVNHALKDWLCVLVHEYCHSLQYQEKDPIWINGGDSYNKFFEWLGGETRLSKKDLNYHCRKALMIELDCERRTVKMIKKYNLPISQSEYCRRASAYIYFYLFVKKMKRWYKIGKEPYRNDNILKLMPSNLDGSYSRLNKKILSLYMECVE